MALKIKLADNKEYQILTETTVFPSGNTAVRSRMEIRMAEGAMPLDDFVALFSDGEKTKTMHIINEEQETDITYTWYIAVSEIGKKRVDTVNHETGEVVSGLQLVAVVEQLTYIEQKLHGLGLL